jgi:hypothetical protein
VGALAACVGILATGILLSFTEPAPPSFDTVKARLGDVYTEAIPGVDPARDRYRFLRIGGAACSAYYYSDSWASSVGLPRLKAIDAGQPVTLYVPKRSCQGFNAARRSRMVAIDLGDHLYATDEYLHPGADRLANLPAALLLAVIGAGGLVLLLRRR